MCHLSDGLVQGRSHFSTANLRVTILARTIDMRVRVGYAVEDCVVIEQSVESIDIYVNCEDEQQERNRDREPPPLYPFDYG